MVSKIRLLVLSMLLLAVQAFAQDIGRVHFISGESDLERGGQKTPLQAFAGVRQSDVIRTGNDGHVQLVMVDGARIAVRPNTRLSLEQYEFTPSDRGAGRALLSLLTGTIRVFTGAIVERDRERFRMKTNLANVGIRGSGNILANLDGRETLNHTLTGAHIVTSRDSLGVERTLISYPGQTVQVLPGQPPRLVPTPALIMAAASPPAKTSSEKASETAQTSAAGGSSSSSSSGSTSTTGSGGSTTTSAPPPDTSSSSASSGSGSTTSAPPPDSSTLPSTSTNITGSNGTTTGSSSPTISGPQSGTGTVGAAIGAAQPSPGYDALARFFSPIPTGWEGAGTLTSFPDTRAVIDAAGHLVLIQNGELDTFLAGGGALPTGYVSRALTGDVTFSGGTHHDGYRSSDGSLIIGRWEGGTVSAGGTVFDLGTRSVSYDVTTSTPVGVIASFTGSATYSMVAATAPTDNLGNVGAVTSAQVIANFVAQTLNGNIALSIGGRNFSLSGTTTLASNFGFSSSGGNINISCSGSCGTRPYLGTINGQFAGNTGRFMGLSYRINSQRTPGSGFSDFVVGNIALDSGTPPTIGIVLPQTGTANYVFNTIDTNRSVSTFSGATGAPSITGTLSANFTSHTAGFNAIISNAGSPTFTASASNAPLVGAGFSASTDSARPSSVGAMTVTCSGTACSGTPQGRFDAFFTSGATSGFAQIFVGNPSGEIDVFAGFVQSTAALVAADARAAVRGISAGISRMPVPFTGMTTGDRLIGRTR